MSPLNADTDWRDDGRDFHPAVELPGVLDSAECETVMGYLDQFGAKPGRVGAEDAIGTRIDREVRRVREVSLRWTPETEWLYGRLAGAVDRCNQEVFGFDLRDFNEELAVVDYREGDFYDWHLDLGANAGSRKLSVSVALSEPDDYEGGGLTFPGLPFDRVPRGNAIVFPSFLLHGVQPVTRGRRCALLAWIGGPRFY